MTGPRVTITHRPENPVTSRPTEFVERKGLGHPDSICDGIAEAVSRRLSQYYRAEFGRILHHNTDEVQLIAGRTAPAFGGGEVLDPIYVLVGGRATRSAGGQEIPVDDLALEAAREYVHGSFEGLSREGIEFDVRIGETSAGLQSLYSAERGPRANDTSVGVGFAPLSETEQIVRGLEPALRDRVAAIGEDVKVMGWRDGETLQLTVAAAVRSRAVADLEDYRAVTDRVSERAREYARARTDRAVSVGVNVADDLDAESVYITETGLSAEMGDDGNVGRGNRVNGLITPHRPTSPEATAGKNPRSHVGKLYNVVADRAAARVHEDLDASHAQVELLSRIGRPVDSPVAVDVDTTARDQEAVESIVAEELASMSSLTDELVAGDVGVF